MQPLFVMVSRMITKVASEEIKQLVHVVVRGMKVVITFQSSVVIIGRPGGDQHAGDHGYDEQHHALHRFEED